MKKRKSVKERAIRPIKVRKVTYTDTRRIPLSVLEPDIRKIKGTKRQIVRSMIKTLEEDTNYKRGEPGLGYYILPDIFSNEASFKKSVNRDVQEILKTNSVISNYLKNLLVMKTTPRDILPELNIDGYIKEISKDIKTQEKELEKLKKLDDDIVKKEGYLKSYDERESRVLTNLNTIHHLSSNYYDDSNKLMIRFRFFKPFFTLNKYKFWHDKIKGLMDKASELNDETFEFTIHLSDEINNTWADYTDFGDDKGQRIEYKGRDYGVVYKFLDGEPNVRWDAENSDHTHALLTWDIPDKKENEKRVKIENALKSQYPTAYDFYYAEEWLINYTDFPFMETHTNFISFKLGDKIRESLMQATERRKKENKSLKSFKKRKN